MKKILRRRISKWSILSIVTAAGLVVAAALALNKPIPEYLVASANLEPGKRITLDELEARPLRLGETGSAYLPAVDFKHGYVVTEFIAKGELVLRRQLSLTQSPNMTSVVLLPAKEISPSIEPGSWVQIWRTIAGPEGFLSERVVERSQVVSVIKGDSLMSGSPSQIEVVVSEEQSALILETMSADQDIYVLVTL